MHVTPTLRRLIRGYRMRAYLKKYKRNIGMKQKLEIFEYIKIKCKN